MTRAEALEWVHELVARSSSMAMSHLILEHGGDTDATAKSIIAALEPEELSDDERLAFDASLREQIGLHEPPGPHLDWLVMMVPGWVHEANAVARVRK